MKNRHGRILGAAIAVLLGIGSLAGAAKIQDTMHAPAPPGSVAPATSPASGPSTGSAAGLAYEGDKLGEEAPSPFIQGAQRSTYEPKALGNARTISFSNGIQFDTRTGGPALAPELTISGYAPTRPGYHVVQFDGPVRSEWRDALERAGAQIIGYVPNYAFLVKLDNTRVASVRSLPHVAWLGLYQPAYKLSSQPELATNSPGRLDVVILLFPGESLAAVEVAITAAGSVVTETAASRNLLIRAQIGPYAARKLATMPEIAWIEP